MKSEPRILWDDSHASSLSPNVVQVKALREEVWLLLGVGRKENSHPQDLRLESALRIILSPYTAKQLSLALNAVVRKYESMDGPSPFRLLPSFQSETARERVNLLFDLLKKLDLQVALERSFKVSEKKLLPNRFLLAFLPDSMPGGNAYEKILGVCRGMNMPEKFLPLLEQDLPQATTVGFGIEEDESTCVVKGYLEFKKRYEEALKKGPKKSDSYVSHWGFKWDAADNRKSALARYTCFPSFTSADILERIAEVFYPDRVRTPFETVKGILELGSRKVGPDKFLYLEVNEENNPRSSFDINLYGANLRVEELYPYLIDICRRYSIPEPEFNRLYDPLRTSIFGHLAGGLDRERRDFLTFYFGSG